MAKRRGKPISFDAMVKFFMQAYEIPTKKDVDRLMAKLDRLETLITVSASHQMKAGLRQHPMTALDAVLDTIKRSKQGAGFGEIQAKTGFGEKKIRNIIFRLNKTGKIKRKSRGIYTAV